MEFLFFYLFFGVIFLFFKIVNNGHKWVKYPITGLFVGYVLYLAMWPLEIIFKSNPQ